MARVTCCSALKCSFKDTGQPAPCVSSMRNADKLHMQVDVPLEWKEGLKAEDERRRSDTCYCGECLFCYLKRFPPRSHVTSKKVKTDEQCVLCQCSSVINFSVF